MEAEAKVCLASSCTRPMVYEGPGVCALHYSIWEAGATLGEWRHAGELLELMIAMSKVAAAEKLTEVLEEVRDLIEDEISLWESEEKRLHDEL